MVTIMNTKHLRKRTVVISYVVFLAGWALRVACLDVSGMNEGLAWMVGFIVHFVWWPFFAFLLIRRYSDELNISLKEMITTKPRLKILLPLLLFAIAYNTLGCLIDSSGFGTTMKLYDLVVTAITVGIFEESVFRGWFFNAISTFVSERKANLISSALFMFIHYPGWIFAGYDFITIMTTSIAVYVLGLLFGWVFRKNRSIWTGAILHSVWDTLTWIL